MLRNTICSLALSITALGLAACVEAEPDVGVAVGELDDFGCTWRYDASGMLEWYCPCDATQEICDGEWTPGPGSGGGGGSTGGGTGTGTAPPPVPPGSTIFSWSSAGPIAGKVCVRIVESADPHSWHDNYLCSATSYGLAWSSAGPIANMRCTRIYEPLEPAAHTWNDNYLCVPTASSLNFTWSLGGGGLPTGASCVRLAESADAHGWNDNYLCH